ncbi:uncharacterized protein LOC120528108 isoform X1 [Polypterus senegalus]|uniref:uncharacterized protein LOC120528108 isoform X1 n=1 Tax=Polypterus senegalus TaxID=55291 RepID=UPI0019650E80|nr:uncharacterized protein LOC120528108 isoform X1 [Polypterus senegalus]XP_039608076.1 uncharacterized protein LOC120528108 isoform X1 [Polypterus senegalus]
MKLEHPDLLPFPVRTYEDTEITVTVHNNVSVWMAMMNCKPDSNGLSCWTVEGGQQMTAIATPENDVILYVFKQEATTNVNAPVMLWEIHKTRRGNGYPINATLLRQMKGCKKARIAHKIITVALNINVSGFDIKRHEFPRREHIVPRSTGATYNCRNIQSLWPPHKVEIKRRPKRDIWGAIGAGLGIGGLGLGSLNTADIAAIYHKISSIGVKQANSLQTLAHWGPELADRHIQELLVWKAHQGWLNESLWTGLQSQWAIDEESVCYLKQIIAIQQYLNFKTDWGLKNPQHWKKELKLPADWWLQPKSFMCEESICQAVFQVATTVEEDNVWCPFHVLPVLLGGTWWTPIVDRHWIDLNNNTVEPAFCYNWQEGFVCQRVGTLPHPCLHPLAGDCYWRQIAVNSTEVFQTDTTSACAVTVHNITWSDGTYYEGPGVSCRTNVSNIRDDYYGRTYMLTTWEYIHWEAEANPSLDLHFAYEIELPKYKAILEHAKQYEHLFNVTLHKARDLLVRLKTDETKVITSAEEIEEISTHHWWHFFTKWSPSSNTMVNVLVHPLVLLIIIIIIFTITNIYLHLRIRRVKQELDRHHTPRRYKHS